MLIDYSNNDDSGVYKIDSKNILVQSLDFITPVVDDLYIYGQIAAANSLSDVFAKGARALTAMSILMWDKEHLDSNDIYEVLQGSLDKLIESNCALIGGHSVIDIEQKYGLSVTGLVEDGIFWPNNSAKVGDSIIITKPIGSGILINSLKNNNLEFNKSLDFINSMRTLNLKASLEAKNFKINACTDITGYGLLGHLNEMINESISINVYSHMVPLFEGVLNLVENAPMGSHRNKSYLQKFVSNTCDINDIVFYDAQTSGGLLIALNSKDAKDLLNNLNDNGIKAYIIAECIPKGEFNIYLK